MSEHKPILNGLLKYILSVLFTLTIAGIGGWVVVGQYKEKVDVAEKKVKALEESQSVQENRIASVETKEAVTQNQMGNLSTQMSEGFKDVKDLIKEVRKELKEEIKMKRDK